MIKHRCGVIHKALSVSLCVCLCLFSSPSLSPSLYAEEIAGSATPLAPSQDALTPDTTSQKQRRETSSPVPSGSLTPQDNPLTAVEPAVRIPRFQISNLTDQGADIKARVVNRLPTGARVRFVYSKSGDETNWSYGSMELVPGRSAQDLRQLFFGRLEDLAPNTNYFCKIEVVDSQGRTIAQSTLKSFMTKPGGEVLPQPLPDVDLHQTLTTPEDVGLEIALRGSDPNRDRLTYTIVNPPTHGTLQCNGAKCHYTPAPDFDGTDFFTYKAHDGMLSSNIAEVTLNMISVNDSPRLDPIQDLIIRHEEPTELLLSPKDVDRDNLSLTVSNIPHFARLIDNGNGTWILRFEHVDASDNGTYSLTVRVSDGTLTSEQSFTVRCDCPLDSPTPSPDMHSGTEGDLIHVHGQMLMLKESTHRVVQSGSWFDASIWENGEIPGEGAVVEIPEGISVGYNGVSAVRLDTLKVRGHLRFSTDQNTKMMVGDFIVTETGHLEIGSPANPIQPDVIAEVVIADKPIDVEKDANQLGTGLIGFGKVEIHGAKFEQTFVRLAAEPKAGDTTLTLTQVPAGWKIGDRLAIPDTRQLRPEETHTRSDQTKEGFIPQREEVTIQAISGNTIFLASSLLYNHPGGYDGAGQLSFLPHVANLSRNVILRSENPLGVRGHTLFTYRADIDIRYAAFQNLGRTLSQLDAERLTSPLPGHVNPLQKGRYAVHAHHLWGKQNPTNAGYQYQWEGNAVEGANKWAMVMHGSHFGLVKDNVVYQVRSDGIVTEDGSEYGNEIVHNFVIGTAMDDKPARLPRLFVGRNDGGAFWLQGPMNYVRGNVAASATVTAYLVPRRQVQYVMIPKFRGANMADGTQVQKIELAKKSLLDFSGNEAYGATTRGVEFWDICGEDSGGGTPPEPCVIKDTTLWNIHGIGVHFYYNRGTFEVDGLVIRGVLQNATQYGPVGIRWNQGTKVAKIRRADIQGLGYGVMLSNQNHKNGRPLSFTMEDSYLRNHVNLLDKSERFVGGGPVTAIFRNVIFATPTVGTLSQSKGPAYPPPTRNIVMAYPLLGISKIDFTAPDSLYLYNYNGSGVSYRVFFEEQAPNVLMPATIYSSDGKPLTIGCPEAGLTNLQCWEKYGVALAGAVAPGDVAAARLAAQSLRFDKALAYKIDENGNILL